MIEEIIALVTLGNTFFYTFLQIVTICVDINKRIELYGNFPSYSQLKHMGQNVCRTILLNS